MKIGIVGSGMIVRFILDIWKGFDEISVSAIWCRSVDRKNAEKIATDYGIKIVYEDYNEFLKDDSFDFVYIGLVNSLHYEYSKKALESGKSVICEKPFTSTAQQANDLLEIAKKNHMYVFESILPWYSDNYDEIKNRLPEIGDIKMFQCNFSQYSRRYDRYLEGKVLPVFDPMLDGGALYDINVYNIHWVMGLAGTPKSVKYYPNIGYNGIDTSGVLVMDYGNFKAVCISAKDSATPGFCMVQGDNGCIVMHSEAGSCEKIDLIMNKKAPVRIDVAPLGEPFANVYKRILSLVDKEDYDGCYKLMELVVEVMRVMEMARKDAGIRFSCD